MENQEIQQIENESFAAGKTFPQAEKQSAELLSLPMHPKLTEGKVDFITEKLKDSCSE